METITFGDFVTGFEMLTGEDREKEAALLAGEYPEFYTRYWVEVCGEELT